MKRKILVADDDANLQTLIKRALREPGLSIFSAFDGEQAIAQALKNTPDLILLDIDMPKKDGRAVIRELRSNLRTKMIPIIMLTASATVADKVGGLALGADDYITKPFALEELRARVDSLFRRSGRELSANPLTRLPGAPAIEDDVNRRIRDGVPFAFLYVDIDHFKAFNDAYGYVEGDRVIKDTAGLLMDVVKLDDRSDEFVGHVGGDDFVVITSPAAVDEIASTIVTRFDAKAPSYYKEEDRQRGFVTTRNRLGQEQRFPLISLTLAAATTEKRILGHYGKVVEIASEIKRYLKAMKERRGSIFLKDRWTEKSPFQ